MEKVKTLIEYRNAGNSKNFFEYLNELVPEIKPYVEHRLKVLEALGQVPENMYDVRGIIDDVFLNLYSGEELNSVEGKDQLKILIFKKINAKLKEIVKKEAFHKDSVSTDKILQRELNKLKERYTINADNDLVMNEELNDISYHQKDFKKEWFLYDDRVGDIALAFHPDTPDEKRLSMLSFLYRFLSPEASNVVDLYVFGKLSIYQIASVKGADESVISKIIEGVEDRINYTMGRLKD